MINIAICDDEQIWMDELERQITEILGQEIVISRHTNPFSLMTYIVDTVKGACDVVYMDVRLKSYNGIMAAESILDDYPNIKIVFVSEDINCVTDIFRINPAYFLMKPYDRRYVRDSLYKIMNIINDESTDIITVGSVTSRRGQTVIKTRNIYYIESQMRVVHIHMFDNCGTYYEKLGEIEDRLKANFIRCHQSFIVNMDKIKYVRNNVIVLYNGAEIPISRKRYKETMDIINKYLGIS